jgi:DUF1707 SHOCT-like domain/Cell wall-active antibiotics response LiaF, C-terminal
MVREHVRVTDESLPAILASDAEREQVAEVLRQASVDGRLTLDEFSQRVEGALAARTRADLQAITADLPEPVPGAPPVRAVPVARTRTPVRWSVAIMGSTTRKGFWRVDEQSSAVAVMGNCKLDLRGALISSPVTEINAVAIMGGVDVIVPYGVEVELEGVAIMGGKDLKLTGPPPGPGAPVVRVNAFAVMGGITIRDRSTLGERLRTAIEDKLGGGLPPER